MSKLEITGLTKKYGNCIALDNLSLTVNDNELLAVLGPSGCGKSTLLSVIAGIEEADSGKIELDGECFSDAVYGYTMPPEKRNIGFVFQNYALWPHMCVEKNLSYPLRLRKAPREFIDLEVKRILSLLRLDEKQQKYPGELSGGEQQRVALGRALIMNPRILLLDEPLSNLDAKLREEMQVEIRHIQQKLSLTVVHVTHDQGEAMAMSDRVSVMNNGRVVQTGSPCEIYENPTTLFSAGFVGSNNLLHGEMVSGGASAVFKADCGISTRVDTAGSGISGACVCIIRPEDVLLSSEQPEAGDYFPATIIRRIYKGAHVLYTIEVGGITIKAQTHSFEQFQVNAQVYFTLRKAVYLSDEVVGI